MSSSKLQLRLCLIALALLPYLNALGAGFTLDDSGMILHNPAVQAPGVPLGQVLKNPYMPGFLYRPLTVLTFWLNRWIDPGAFGFHLANVMLHLIVTLLAYNLACRLLPRAGAFVAAALFAVHPIHTEAVTSVVGRAELLAAGTILGALLCAQRARDGASRRPLWLVGGATLFALGLLSKESAFVLLPLLVVLRATAEHTGLARASVHTLRSAEGAVFGVVALSYLAWRWLLFGTLTLPEAPLWLDNPLAHVSVTVRLATAAVILADYAALLLFPLRLSADYSFNQVPLVTTAADTRLLAAALLTAGVTVVVWRSRRSLPVAPAAVLFTLVALSLTANVLFPIGTIKAERLLYLPSLGLCLFAGGLASACRRRHPAITLAVCLAIIAALGGRTWIRNRDWQSNLTLFRAAVAAAPHSAKVHHNLGVALSEIGHYRDAAFAFRQALALYPLYEEAAFGIGRMYERRGQTAGALHWYNEAVRLNPRFARGQLNRGVIYYNRGDYAAAEKAFRAGLASSPDDAELLTGMGLSRLACGDAPQAAVFLRRALELDDAREEARRALRLALRAHGRHPESL